MILSHSLILALQNALLLLVLCSLATAILSCLSDVIASTTGGLIADYLTFPGVIHHELSHALFAFICGAQVTKVVPFKFDHADGRLGYIAYIPRGPRILQSLQKTLSGIAPVLCGVLSTSLLYFFALPLTSGWGVAAIWYLMICIIFHMTLSAADWRNIRSGLLLAVLIFMLVATAFFFATRIDLIASLMKEAEPLFEFLQNI